MTDARNCEHSSLSARLGVSFQDPELLEIALTHRSYSAEHSGNESYERLEFLGDAVLGLAITECLYIELPDRSEGELAKLRAAVVNADALADVARALDVGAGLRLGKGEALSGGREKGSILADALEAVIGAVYVDRGYSEAKALVTRLLSGALSDEIQAGAGGKDYKTRLQELVARRFDDQPAYRIEETGPDHGRRFHATVEVSNQSVGSGEGTSKKRAEQAAARAAFNALTRADDEGEQDDGGAARS